MSVLTQKFSEDEMYRALGTLLKPDEGIMAAIYCVYKDTGFFASSRHIMYGYAAITDQNRFVGFRSSFINTTALQFNRLSKSPASLGGALTFISSGEYKLPLDIRALSNADCYECVA